MGEKERGAGSDRSGARRCVSPARPRHFSVTCFPDKTRYTKTNVPNNAWNASENPQRVAFAGCNLTDRAERRWIQRLSLQPINLTLYLSIHCICSYCWVRSAERHIGK